MKCSRCKKKALISLKYAGQSLCKDCFIEFFERRSRKAIAGELKGVKKLAIGLSGGKDSSAMMYILKSMVRVPMFAITIDGGIRGYDDKLLANAKKLAKKLGVKHYVFPMKKDFGFSAGDIAKMRPGLCNCGIFKRYLLNRKARELKAGALAIGHNLDDMVQSMLMNDMRGDVERIIRGEGILKHEKFVPRVKPLKKSPENEVALYAKLVFPGMRFTYECPYRKEFLRFHVKKMIDYLEEKHPGIKYQIYEGNEKIRNALKKKKIGKPNLCRICKEICASDVCQVCEFKQDFRTRNR